MAKFIKPANRSWVIICVIAIMPMAYLAFSAGFFVGSKNALRDDSLTEVVEADTEANLESFAWAARSRLEDFRLDHRLMVTQAGINSLRISGDISADEVERWRKFLKWYASHPTFPELIQDINHDSSGHDFPRVDAVWFDGEPAVVFRDGTVATIGSHLKDGWQVVSISYMAIMLERDGTRFSLTF